MFKSKVVILFQGMVFLKKIITLTFAIVLLLSLLPLQAAAVGKGASYNGNEVIKNERLTSYEDLVKQLGRANNRSENIDLEVIGQSVKGRDLHLVKFGNNPKNPTILFLTQQHGNEALITEAALDVIRTLSGNSRNVQELADQVNVFFVPRLNPDGAEGDVNFDTSDHVLGGQATVNNANNVNLNRDHIDRIEPETAALHNNVLQKYDIDYLVDFHHQSAQYAVEDRYVSGAILYPTNTDVDENVVKMSKQLGAVMYDAVEHRGFGNIGKYVGGDALTISRNGLAYEYGIATLLFENRGKIDDMDAHQILGQKSNGNLIRQSVIAMEAAIEAIADQSINSADTKFWDTLPEQYLSVD